MISFRDLPIRRKMTWATIAVSATALLLACAAFLAYDLVSFREAKVHTYATLAEILGFNSASALLFRDPASAETTLAALRAEPHVISAGIYTQDGQPFAAFSRAGSSGVAQLPKLPAGTADGHEFKAGQLALFRQILFEGKAIGTVYIQSDLVEIRERAQRYVGIAALVLFASLFVALLISFKLQRVISDPILRLSEAARTISARKDYSVRAAGANRDEMGLLIGTFNEMLAQIEQRDAALQEAHNQMEQRVRARTAELQAANAELEAFTYSVSHDLRAPLRHIDGFSKILMEEHSSALPPDAQRYLARVRQGTQQMGRLVDDLLNLARLGRQEVRLQVAGLDSVVREVRSDLQRDAEGRDVEWQVSALPFVECDPALMKQVFANLLSNALKYTRPRPKAIIQVSQTQQNGQPVVFVRDNGVGFNMKYADKLFGVFQRLHRAEDFEGTGVGLATVQRIIHKHGGKVWAEAELDKGATFYFTLGTTEETTQQTGQTEAKS